MTTPTHTSESTYDEDTEPMEESELLLEMVRCVVRNPGKVSVSATRSRDTTVLTISVDEEDLKHVIGREHRTIDAITHLIAKSAAMGQHKAIVNLDTTGR